MTVRRIVLALFVTISIAVAAPAAAAVPDICSTYNNAVEGISGGSVPVVPDRLLINWREALGCLVPIIGKLSPSVTSPKFTSEVRSKYLSATGAIRAIMTQLSQLEERSKSLPPDQRSSRQDTLTDFTNEFRRLDNLDVISVLTYGARSGSYDMRLNAVLILGNVIDNSTVCVPLVQLYDKRNNIQDEPYFINGRANLLGVISVVAPWAYFENFQNIERTRQAIIDATTKNDPSLQNTYKILDNIQQRLGLQNDKTNKKVNLPQQLRDDCKAYMQRFEVTPDLTKNISY